VQINKIRRSAGLVAGVAAALILAGCGSSGSSSSAAAPATTSANPAAAFNLVAPGKLTVGMTLQFKPEMYLDASGQPAGYDVALVKQLAADAGLQLDIKNMDFSGLIPGLVSKTFDLVSVGLSNTPERAKSIDFTREYVPYAQILAAQAGTTPSTNVADWNNAKFTITALQGSTGANLVKKTFPKAHLKEFPDQTSAFLEVATKRADATVVESYLFNQFDSSNPGKLIEVKTAAPLHIEYGSWAVQKGNAALQTYLNTWLCKAQTGGFLASTYLKEQAGALPPMPATC
jgi:ABC-type amino acid transport substrate-binding protein